MAKVKGLWVTILKFIQEKKVITIVLGVFVIGIVSIFALGGGDVPETISLSEQALVRNVKVSGKVIPRERVDLSFETSGKIAYVGKDVGQEVAQGEVLARLDSGAIAAQLLQSEAELASAKAEKAKLEGTESYENSISNAKRAINQVVLDAYTAASDAVYNKADPLFVNPRSSRPVLAGEFNGNIDLRDSINKNRVVMGDLLEDWQKIVAKQSLSNQELQIVRQYLTQVTSFISDVSRAVNMFEATSWMPQSQIDGYKADILAARENLNQVMQKSIEGDNTLSKLIADVPVQVAKVEAAQASVLNLRFQLGKTSLISPIFGVVAKQDAKLGQTVSQDANLVSVISKDYQVETFVPEVSIAGIQAGNMAKVTLDAYGAQEVFDATVVHIDPAETIRDGVSTYKVKLAFSSTDERVKSGMTANVEIETFRKPNVFVIPERTLVREGDRTFVYVLEGKNDSKKTEVVLGERDLRGSVEVVSGLSGSDQVLVTPPKE